MNDPNADLAGGGGDDLASPSSGDMKSGTNDMASRTDMGTPPSDMGSPEGNPLLNGITAEHNKARANVNPVPAIPLPAMTWDTTVAATAQSWANNCMFMHNPSSGYGENIYATSGSATPAAVVANWVAEQANYNYSTNTCSSTCGHYTQVVWRTSIRLGCGVKNCTMNSPFGGGNWQFWVCDYDPPGNSGGRPY